MPRVKRERIGASRGTSATKTKSKMSMGHRYDLSKDEALCIPPALLQAEAGARAKERDETNLESKIVPSRVRRPNSHPHPYSRPLDDSPEMAHAKDSLRAMNEEMRRNGVDKIVWNVRVSELARGMDSMEVQTLTAENLPEENMNVDKDKIKNVSNNAKISPNYSRAQSVPL